MVEGISVYSPLQGQALHQHPSQGTSLQATNCPNGKVQWMDHSTLPRCAVVKVLPSPEGIPRSLRLRSGTKRRNGGAGHGSSKRHYMIWKTPGGAMQRSTGAPQVHHPSGQAGGSVRPWNVGCGKEGLCSSCCPYRGASSSELRVEEPIGLPASNKLHTLETKEAVHSEEMALVWRRRPLAPPGLTFSWVDECNPSPRGCSLTS